PPPAASSTAAPADARGAPRLGSKNGVELAPPLEVAIWLRGAFALFCAVSFFLLPAAARPRRLPRPERPERSHRGAGDTGPKLRIGFCAGTLASISARKNPARTGVMG